jgi:hypothetical protein
MASLVDNEGKQIQLATGRSTTIGRSRDNDVVISHPSVSRRHAEIVWENGGFFIRDLGSRNGTWVGSRRVTKLQLFNGDFLRLGDLEFLFENRHETLSSGKARPKRQAHFFSIKSRIAIILFFILGFGATALILWRLLPSLAPPTPSASTGNESFGWNTGTVNQPAERMRVSHQSPFPNSNARATAAGEAILQTDRQHRDDISWISLEPTARMCNQGVLPADSIFCRVAYLGRHAEGKDLDRGPRTIEPAEIATFCVRGAIDPRLPICGENSTTAR